MSRCRSKEEKIKAKKEKKKSKKGKGGIIALIIIIFVVIAAAGTAGFLYFTSDGYQIEKNMKQAAEAFEEEEYRSALKYYDTALDLDSSLTDAYLGSADIYLIQEKYENAYEILEKGLKKTKDAEDSEDAGELLTDKLTEIYLAEANSLLKNGSYEQALNVLATGYGSTEDNSLLQKRPEIYNAYADTLTAEEKYIEAIEILTEGSEDTGNSSLSERAENLKENLYLKKRIHYYNNVLSREAEYDEAGNTTTLIYYDEYGNLNSRYEYQYDENGNTISYMSYDAGGNLTYGEENTFDENGNNIAFIGYWENKIIENTSVSEYRPDRQRSQDPWSGEFRSSESAQGHRRDFSGFSDPGQGHCWNRWEYSPG